MTQIKIKRVYDPVEKSDGYRILVDKLWPRGIKKENLHYDLWDKDIAPSTALRQWYHKNTDDNWEDFRKKYTDELNQSAAIRSLINRIKHLKTVTLLYAAKNTGQNHALVLQSFIQKTLKQDEE